MSWINAKLNMGRAVRRMSQDATIVIQNFPTSGTRIGGRWVESEAVSGALTASVQPAAGESLQLLPEGLRTTDAIEVWGLTELRPLARKEGQRATLIEWKGRTYSAEHVEDWYENGRYWFAVATLVDQ